MLKAPPERNDDDPPTVTFATEGPMLPTSVCPVMLTAELFSVRVWVPELSTSP